MGEEIPAGGPKDLRQAPFQNPMAHEARDPGKCGSRSRAKFPEESAT